MRRILLVLVFFNLWAQAQHQDKVDFIRSEVSLEVVPEEQRVIGLVSYEFDILEKVDSIFLDAQNMQINFVAIDEEIVNHDYDQKHITIKQHFKKGTHHTLKIGYSAIPKQTLYFLGWDDTIAENEQIWTQGQGKYTSHWLPSFDDMEEKVEFDMLIVAPKDFTVITNGKLKNAPKLGEGKKTWLFDMQKPMSSYLLAFAIGNYKKQELTSKSGVSIANYYYPADSLKVEPTYRYTREIFDFLEEEIGVSYPWQTYKQIPVRDFLYAGMENTGATIFSDGYVIDSTAFVDKNYVNVNAHEMAHQWFGNLVTEKNGNHHWLHEGFATYYAYLAEKKLFGDDHFYWKFYNSLEQLQDQMARGEGSSLLNPKASSLTFYEKGAWALFILRNEIGDRAFKKGIAKYLIKFQFKNVTVSDFLKEMESASGKDLQDFKNRWLENKGVPTKEAKAVLANYAPSIRSLFDMEAELKAAQSDDIDYEKYWNTTTSIFLKKYILERYKGSLPLNVIEKAIAADTIPIRQALLTNEASDSLFSREQLESFLSDHSFVSKEAALLKLWRTYPEGRSDYLEATENVIGLPSKNLRLLWLTLAILTDGYNGKMTKQYFDELSGYTAPHYSYEVRQGAFSYLEAAFGFDDSSLSSLVQASGHHSWQFRKFARRLLDQLLEDEDYKARLVVLADELKPVKTRYLKSKLESE